MKSLESQPESKTSWMLSSRRRAAAWFRTRCAERVLAPNEQRTSFHLTSEMVMRSRDEKISRTDASPINTGGSDERING